MNCIRNTIKTSTLKFITDNAFKKRDVEKLRGYIGNLYKDEDLFHNHSITNNPIYRFPLIQYRIINNNPMVIAYKEGVTVLNDKFLKIESLIIDGREIKIFEKQLDVKNQDFFVSDTLCEYIFDSLWLPINQKNYLSYINNKLDLDKVLANNILSNFKGLDITAEKKIMVKGNFKERSVYVNNIETFGFSGDFVSNVVIPDYMGVGKFKSIGFGVVRRVTDERRKSEGYQ
ncbi:MAG: DNA repair protein [Spirochaetes bacterium]|nr:DNA repair protein [Spirochaetota bacterium]